MPAKPASKPPSKVEIRAAARAARAKVVESAKALRESAQQAVSDAAVTHWAQAAKLKTEKQAKRREMPEAESVSSELRDVTSGQEALRNKMDEEEEHA